jgi:hypothetical protein
MNQFSAIPMIEFLLNMQRIFSKNSAQRHSRKGDSELELVALQACAATLCCGVVYDPSGLNENGYIYSWLNRLLAAHNELVEHYPLFFLLITSCVFHPDYGFFLAFFTILLSIIHGIEKTTSATILFIVHTTTSVCCLRGENTLDFHEHSR